MQRHGTDGHSHPLPAALHRQPPCNLEAEAGVLGGAMLCPDGAEVLPALAAMLPDPAAFHREAHEVIWRHVLKLYRAGTPVDTLTVYESLRAAGDLAAAGGAEYLGELAANVPHAVNAPHYAAVVRQKAELRAAIEKLHGALADAYAQQDSPEAIVARAVDSLRGLTASASGNDATAAEVVAEAAEAVRRRRSGELVGLATPWAELDTLTGGLQSEDFVIVAARPGMGKTVFGVGLAEFAAVDWGRPSLIVSLEMGNAPLAERMLAGRSGVPLRVLRTGGAVTAAQQAALDRAAEEIAAAPLHFLRRPSRSAAEVAYECRRLHARHNLALIVVDYVQLMHGDNPRDSENAALTKVSATLKHLARDLGCPVVALSQLNRDLKARADKRPTLTDIRASGSLEQDADLVLMLHRPEYYDPHGAEKGLAEVLVPKSRNGPPGEFKLTFDGSLVRFRDYVPAAVLAPPPDQNPPF